MRHFKESLKSEEELLLIFEEVFWAKDFIKEAEAAIETFLKSQKEQKEE